MKTFKAEMLIRDKRLKWMHDRDFHVNYRQLSEGEFETHLRKKLVEESNEVLLEKTQEGLIEEIADVMEVIEYLMKLRNISKQDIQKAKDKKQEKLGRFDDRIYTRSISIAEDNPNIAYYLHNAHKYPEIKT
ncbi:MAG: nucleoside triphosphate pyrophosphohydrolase [Alphaproteobacteria bacterium]|nr:nucleoside triphosphate pyrophosphohydrolase [Alphaproteobacteria bacterium]MBN2780254.1 nucleoside triphosphate pyrophosphohydrolase [Alphaproteobacteria bacterium]